MLLSALKRTSKHKTRLARRRVSPVTPMMTMRRTSFVASPMVKKRFIMQRRIKVTPRSSLIGSLIASKRLISTPKNLISAPLKKVPIVVQAQKTLQARKAVLMRPLVKSINNGALNPIKEAVCASRKVRRSVLFANLGKRISGAAAGNHRFTPDSLIRCS